MRLLRAFLSDPFSGHALQGFRVIARNSLGRLRRGALHARPGAGRCLGGDDHFHAQVRGRRSSRRLHAINKDIMNKGRGRGENGQ